jgi:hypothetical protein
MRTWLALMSGLLLERGACLVLLCVSCIEKVGGGRVLGARRGLVMRSVPAYVDTRVCLPSYSSSHHAMPRQVQSLLSEALVAYGRSGDTAGLRSVWEAIGVVSPEVRDAPVCLVKRHHTPSGASAAKCFLNVEVF